MQEVCYGKEPFDLRLTILRLIRELWKIAAFTFAGTLLFGGGYYLKNVALGPDPMYEITTTYKMEYTEPPMQSGDYYINEMTWNTYLDSDEFYQMLGNSTTFMAMDVTFDMFIGGKPGMEQSVSAAVASDIQVPSVTVSTPFLNKTETLSEAVTQTITGAFADSLPEVANIRVLDVSEPKQVWPDVRPVRAFVLSAVLSLFFAVTLFLLREISADSIWLPAILHRRYGLKTPGTIHGREFKNNMRYLFGQCGNIGVCAVNSDTDPAVVIELLREKMGNRDTGEKSFEKEWIPIPDGGQGVEGAQLLHGVDSVLLVVNAGLHVGKPLEYVLEYLAQQEVLVTAALLWDADEWLIRSYYFLPGGRE